MKRGGYKKIKKNPFTIFFFYTTPSQAKPGQKLQFFPISLQSTTHPELKRSSLSVQITSPMVSRARKAHTIRTDRHSRCGRTPRRARSARQAREEIKGVRRLAKRYMYPHTTGTAVCAGLRPGTAPGSTCCVPARPTLRLTSYGPVQPGLVSVETFKTTAATTGSIGCNLIPWKSLPISLPSVALSCKLHPRGANTWRRRRM